MRFIHTADWQLGMTRHFLDPDAQARFTAARIDAISRIGQVAHDQSCAFVVVCGDVFETNHVERRVVVRALEAMEAAAVAFYLLPGNHDPLDASSVFTSATFRRHQPANVHVLDRAGVHVVAPGVELIAAPWTSKRPLVDLCAAATSGVDADGIIRIVAGHGAVDSLSPDPTDPALIGTVAAEATLASGCAHYVALGDRHSTTQVGTSGRIWYSGAPEPTDYDEVDPGNVLVVEASTTHIQVTPVALGTWRFVRRSVPLDSVADIDQLGQWLDSLPGKARTIVKLSLVGTISLTASARLDEVLEHHSDLLGALEIWARHTDLVVLPDELDLDEFDLGGFAKEAVADLHQSAVGGAPEAEAARDALALLYRLASVAS
ncbi:MAG: exonuclease SbcCD subunit D [Acidimicrobiia bacterium]|nr:exonuclease SbcCD subunit D [Acidimicrobiia bacterium]